MAMNKEKKCKILVRVDSGNRIGMGHVGECLSLLDSLQEKVDVEILFLTRDYHPGVKCIRGAGYNVQFVSGTNSMHDEILFTETAIADFNPDVFIVDLLRLNRVDNGAIVIDDSYMRQWQNRKFAYVVLFDDTIHSEIPADLAVNFHIGQDKKFYDKFSQKERYVIGPKYALLDAQLHGVWKQVKKIPPQCAQILVTQGGTDPYKLTMKTIQALETLNLDQKVIVVVGGGFLQAHKKELQEIIPSLKGDYQFQWNVSKNKMYQLMAKSDLAITAAGNTLYELACFGVPSLILCHHKDHDLVARQFVQNQAAVNLGIGTDVSCEYIAGKTGEVLLSDSTRSELSIHGKKLVDGLGTERVAGRIMDILVKKKAQKVSVS